MRLIVVGKERYFQIVSNIPSVEKDEKNINREVIVSSVLSIYSFWY